MSPVRHHPQRETRFESFESRIVLSAQALTDFSDFEPVELDSAGTTAVAETGLYVANFEPGSTESLATQTYAAYEFLGSEQTVAVIDTGIAWDHYALGAGFGDGHRVVGGWDFAENDANPYDDGPAGLHGTHVAGIIGSSDHQHTGVASDVDLVALRVFDDFGRAKLEWVEQALQWVHDHQDSFENPITTVNLSLGADWNSESIPSWSIIEDELAQLEADGLFISVAAGNSFQKYQTTGLSYPAASPHVVPVASLDSAGELSDFSQRTDRVIGAPGENIQSTIPNHLFGSIAPSYRFMSLSGTSMAAPYVAGASVVLREAMTFAGYEDINQATLLQTFRETADSFYDEVTNQSYLALNLDQAISSVLASIDSDEPSPTVDLGTVEAVQSHYSDLSGSATFEAIAKRDGLVSIDVSARGSSSDLRIELLDEHKQLIDSVDGNELNAYLVGNVQANQKVFFKISGDASEIDVRVSNQIGLQDRQLSIFGGEQNDRVELTLGTSLQVDLNGAKYAIDSSKIDSIALDGRSGQDEVAIQLVDGGHRVVMNDEGLKIRGEHYLLSTTDVESYEIASNDSLDKLRIRDLSERLAVSAGFDSLNAHSDSYQLHAEGFQDIRIVASSSESLFRFVDEINDDSLRANEWRALIVADSFRLRAVGFDSVEMVPGGASFAPQSHQVEPTRSAEASATHVNESETVQVRDETNRDNVATIGSPISASMSLVTNEGDQFESHKEQSSGPSKANLLAQTNASLNALESTEASETRHLSFHVDVKDDWEEYLDSTPSVSASPLMIESDEQVKDDQTNDGGPARRSTEFPHFDEVSLDRGLHGAPNLERPLSDPILDEDAILLSLNQEIESMFALDAFFGSLAQNEFSQNTRY